MRQPEKVSGMCEKSLIREEHLTQWRKGAKKTRHLFFPVSVSLRPCLKPSISSHVLDAFLPLHQ